MTLGIKQHKENGYSISMCWEKGYNNGGYYVVQVCPCYNNGKFEYCGYPERKMIYSLNEEKKAIATYNRYVRKYCKGKN